MPAPEPRYPGRYHRQALLTQIGAAGQASLANARALVVGCGATGGSIADLLCRAGVGHLTLVDRDLVEATNLQRQPLFDERDIGEPKAVTAANRLAQINSSVDLVPAPIDLNPRTVPDLANECRPSILIDGTDNFETRFLLNDLAVERSTADSPLPLVVAGVLGVSGTVLPIIPGATPCLRCVFDGPPDPGTQPTCDTAGVLNAAVSVIAGYAAARAIALMVGDTTHAGTLLKLDAWTGETRALDLANSRDPSCPCCGHHRFDFLDATDTAPAALCGQNAVQIPARRGVRDPLDLASLHARLSESGPFRLTPYFLRGYLPERTPEGNPLSLTVFRDGRALIHGTEDLARARSVYDRFVGR